MNFVLRALTACVLVGVTAGIVHARPLNLFPPEVIIGQFVCCAVPAVFVACWLLGVFVRWLNQHEDQQ